MRLVEQRVVRPDRSTVIVASLKCSATSRASGCVLGIAVRRHDDAEHVLTDGQLRHPRHDGRVDPAAQADHDSANAGGRHLLPEPLRHVY